MGQFAQSVNELVEKLRTLKATVGFAESCTGGSLSYAMVALPGVSDVYRGSIVAYDNDLKRTMLRVSESSLKLHGAVSQDVALEMAQGALTQLGVTYAVSVTGIAGPTGGTPDKPVGTVCFAVVGPNLAKTHRIRFAGGRTEIQQQSVETGIELLLREISE